MYCLSVIDSILSQLFSSRKLCNSGTHENPRFPHLSNVNLAQNSKLWMVAEITPYLLRRRYTHSEVTLQNPLDLLISMISLYRNLFTHLNIFTLYTMGSIRGVLSIKLVSLTSQYYYINGKRTVSAFRWYKSLGVCNRVFLTENALAIEASLQLSWF